MKKILISIIIVLLLINTTFSGGKIGLLTKSEAVAVVDDAAWSESVTDER